MVKIFIIKLFFFSHKDMTGWSEFMYIWVNIVCSFNFNTTNITIIIISP